MWASVLEIEALREEVMGLQEAMEEQ